MQRVHFKVLVDAFNCQQILVKVSFIIFDTVVKTKSNVVQRGTGEILLIWDLLIDMFLTSLNAEIVACILLFRKSRHKPNLESTSKYGNFHPIWGKMAAF